jgi:hypothetical protein
VSVYDNTGDGTDRSVALSVLKTVSGGTHTFYFLSRGYAGAGTVLAYDPTLRVIRPRVRHIYLPLVVRQRMVLTPGLTRHSWVSSGLQWYNTPHAADREALESPPGRAHARVDIAALRNGG